MEGITTEVQRLSERAAASTSSTIRDLLRLVDRPAMLSMAGGLPSPELLPTDRLRLAADEVLSRHVTARRAAQYSASEGLGELRDVLAARLACDVDDVTVTTGSQQAVDLVVRAVIDPGDVVVVESPTYLGSLQAFRSHGAEVVSVPGDGSGMRVDRLAEMVGRGLVPRLVYVVPNFANPTGATMPLDRRVALVELAARHGFVVLEDDPYGELRWRGESLPSLCELAAGTGAAVASAGSASKVLAPGLRVGWMRAPGWLASAVVRLKQSTDLHTSSLDQLLVAHVLADGAFMAGHVAAIRSVYASRSRALVDALRTRLGDVLQLDEPDGGMFVWAHRRDGASTVPWFAAALDHDVAFVPGGAFSPDPAGGRRIGSPAAALRMCFTTLGEHDLRDAVDRLATAEAASTG